MRFGLWPTPATPWNDTLALARRAETLGIDSLWYADHFMPMAGDLSQPVNESWTALSALAVHVPRVRLGHLVNGNTYRHPAVLAKMAAGLDIISGGRFVLGLGAGWQENEHTAYGIPFGSLAERLQRLEEACLVVTGLLRKDRTDVTGAHYQLTGAPLAPKPLQDRLPLLIGGGGEKVTLRIAAHYADEWNVWGLPPVIDHKSRVLAKHCRRIRRDPASIQRSAVALVPLSQDAVLTQRIESSGRPMLSGSPAQMQATLGAYADLGLDEFILPDWPLGLTVDEKGHALERFLSDVAAPFRTPAPSLSPSPRSA